MQIQQSHINESRPLTLHAALPYLFMWHDVVRYLFTSVFFAMKQACIFDWDLFTKCLFFIHQLLNYIGGFNPVKCSTHLSAKHFPKQ